LHSNTLTNSFINSFVNTLDKVIFATVLILAFQIPIISDHYLQYLSGYFQSTKDQVAGYQKNALQHQYANVDEMIADLLQSKSPVVRSDAMQKQQNLTKYHELTVAIEILQTGDVFQRAWYMFNPSRWQVLKQVMVNFKPGLPLTIKDLLYACLFALLASFLLMLPIKWLMNEQKTV